VLDLLRLPHVGVEPAVDLRRVREHRRQLQDVAVHLQVDPGHVVQDVAVATLEAGGVDEGEVGVLDAERRVFVGDPVDMRAETALES
jgi:hypothetical protein